MTVKWHWRRGLRRATVTDGHERSNVGEDLSSKHMWNDQLDENNCETRGEGETRGPYNIIYREITDAIVLCYRSRNALLHQAVASILALWKFRETEINGE